MSIRFRKSIDVSIGPGLQLEPGGLLHLPQTAKILLTPGLPPAAIIAIVLNLASPEDLPADQAGEVIVQSSCIDAEVHDPDSDYT